ncbi:Hypothetical predicted protein [Paramuricea clavata]|uniref:Uncharacterized protein n=1 Tax=Paramuricea clavata TaxID=317549 RepID=A0A7D9J2Z5_PARCT|nr:Hypothetical predicted protein [Paramuricea clavata]
MYRPRMREQVDEDAETQDPFNCFEDNFNAFYEEQTSNRIQNCQLSITSGSRRNDATPTRDSSGVSGNNNSERLILDLQKEVATVKRTLSRMQDVQEEILACVKKIRRGTEAEKFDLSNCCHTENITQLLGKYYTSKARFPMDFPEKQQALKLEFNNSPTGLSVEELLLRFKKFESSKMSYWRSEERRRVSNIYCKKDLYYLAFALNIEADCMHLNQNETSTSMAD